MGIFSNIFSGSSEPKEEKQLPWIELTSLEQLDDIAKMSITKPQIIFKHSTRCGISRMVLNQFKAAYNLSQMDADLYYLDLLNYRTVSDEIGYRFQVIHESPQLLIVKDGIVEAHASHGGINEMDLASFV